MTTPPPRRPTIREVARRADVSHQTVSRYLRDDPGMLPETRARITAAITELDYRPNPTARALKARRPGRLACVVPLGTATATLPILNGARKAAAAQGYGLEMLLLDDGDDRTRESRIFEFADSGFFDGLVSLVPLPERLHQDRWSSAPVIVTNDYDVQMRSIGDIADGSPIKEIVRGLAAAGHRRLFHLAGDLEYASARNRLTAYERAITEQGLESTGVALTGWDPQVATRAMLDPAFPRGTTAVVAANDVLAAAAVRAAGLRGLRVPDDLAVTGWDDNPVGAIMPPSLTTVAVDYEGVGRRAVQRLLAAVRGEPTSTQPAPLHRVIWRASTGHDTSGGDGAAPDQEDDTDDGTFPRGRDTVGVVGMVGMVGPPATEGAFGGIEPSAAPSAPRSVPRGRAPRLLPDEVWAAIASVLGEHAPRAGRPFRDPRDVVEGALWHYRHGGSWRELPAEFGPWQTVWRRDRDLRANGTWRRVRAALRGWPGLAPYADALPDDPEPSEARPS